MTISRINPDWSWKYTELLPWGVYSTQGQTVTLNDDFKKYKFLVVRSGYNTDNPYGGGMVLDIIPSYFYQDPGAQYNITYFQQGQWRAGKLEHVDGTHFLIASASGYTLRQIIGVN